MSAGRKNLWNPSNRFGLKMAGTCPVARLSIRGDMDEEATPGGTEQNATA